MTENKKIEAHYYIYDVGKIIISFIDEKSRERFDNFTKIKPFRYKPKEEK